MGLRLRERQLAAHPMSQVLEEEPWRSAAAKELRLSGIPQFTLRVISADAVGRYGPAGGMLFIGAARRWTEADGPSALTRGRYAQVGASAGVNPAYAQGSLVAEWVPIAVLQLKLEYDV
jgi:hypothetical protein